MPEYTVAAVVAAVAVVVAELAWFRTGLLRTRAYWISMAIVFFFQVLVDGWLTKLTAPIVRYDPGQFLGVRFPWDVPIEDYLYGFALVTLTMLLWDRRGSLEER
jgi:lycopene cyclase domain-containing protein